MAWSKQARQLASQRAIARHAERRAANGNGGVLVTRHAANGETAMPKKPPAKKKPWKRPPKAAAPVKRRARKAAPMMKMRFEPDPSIRFGLSLSSKKIMLIVGGTPYDLDIIA